MVRAGEVSPTELVRLYLDRIERFDPQLNAFRKVFAEKALLEAEQAEARLKAGEERPLLGVPIAIKDEVDVAGEVKTIGTDGFTEPADADCEMVRRLREAGAIVVGLTLLPEMAICGFTESATYGVTRNPWDPQRTPGRLERRLRRRGRGGPGADRLGRRRRRLDPHPGRLLRALRPQAPARAGLAGARSRTVERPRGQRLPQPHRARHRALARRDRRRLEGAGGAAPPERPFLESARTPPGKLRVAWSTAPPRRPRRRTSRRRQGRGRRDRRAAALAGPRRRPARPRLGRDRQQHGGALPRAASPKTSAGPAAGAARTPHPGLRPARLAGPDGLYERRAPRREADAARVNAIFDSHDVLITPVIGGTAMPVRRWEGRGRSGR